MTNIIIVFFSFLFFQYAIVHKRVSTYVWIAVFPTFVIHEKEGRSYDLEHSVGVSLHTERRSREHIITPRT
jgi:hypothetical protein